MTEIFSSSVIAGRFTPARIFLFLAPIIYLSYALLMPPFQTPDEHQHLFRAYQLATGEIIGERRGYESGGMLPQSLTRAAKIELTNTAPHVAGRPLTQASFGERFRRATPLNLTEPQRFTNFLGAVTYTPAGYMPQIAAIEVGRMLDLSVETIVRLGRILNIALTICLIYAALRMLPVGRMLLCFIALLPMTAACAASFGQDGLIIGASALLTALSLRAVVLRRWTTREAVVAAIMTSLITLAKFVYVPLAGLALLPYPRRIALWRWALAPSVFAAIALMLTAFWLKAVSGLFVPMLSGMPAPAEQIAYLAHHPSTFLATMIETYGEGSGHLARMLFLFGWLNVGPIMPAAYAASAALLIVIWHGDAHARLLPPLWRIWAWAIGFATIVLLTLAMYVLGSPLGATSVSGLQGRYFLPLALPLLLPLLRQRRGDSALAEAAIIVLNGLANVIVLRAICSVYYGV